MHACVPVCACARVRACVRCGACGAVRCGAVPCRAVRVHILSIACGCMHASMPHTHMHVGMHGCQWHGRILVRIYVCAHAWYASSVWHVCVRVCASVRARARACALIDLLECHELAVI